MQVLVTGSSGHLGQARMRMLGHSDAIKPVGLDLLSSPYTTAVGSVADQKFVRR